jgi:phosphoribosylformylglycinamidine (FGAM) synthase-like enzyme
LIHRFSVRSVTGAEPDDQRRGRALGLPDLESWLDYYVEFDAPPSPDATALVCAALADQPGTRATVDEPFPPGTVTVLHRRGVVDNENSSIVSMCELLGVPARAGKVARCYRSSSPRLRELIEATAFNSAIEEVHDSPPDLGTLIPAGAYLPAARFDLRGLTGGTGLAGTGLAGTGLAGTGLAGTGLAALGRADGRNLSLAQMLRIRTIQESLDLPSVTDVLLEALDARWSDHCAHTTWKSLGDLLGRLVAASREVANPNIVSMFGDNAGVWAFYDGYAIAVKAETHNGPSAISAYFGQLTKLGGVLRDILGTGLSADPIGCFEYTATGLPGAPPPIAGRPGARQIAHDTIQAIKEYGNTFGVPMMWSRMAFHPGYRAKPFALGGSIGILPTSAAQRGTPRSGDLVVLIGGLTGNEGMHGASASSAGSAMDVASVQIGAPLEQVKFRKALIELRDADCLRALTDVGGAGLNSAVGEIGDPSGVWINTALVPLKTSALPMWRILLSESQERMLLAVPADAWVAARRILDRHFVRGTVIGRFTDTGRYCVFHDPGLSEQAVLALPPGAVPAPLTECGELGFDVPYKLLDTPVTAVTVGPLPDVLADVLADGGPVSGTAWPALSAADVAGLLARVVADPDVASQRYADEQYDSTVQGNTVHGPQYGTRARVPAGYWAGTPVDGSPAAAVFAVAFNPWLFDLHPVRALRQMFVSLLSGLVLAGVDTHDICVCDNFYTPHMSPHWAEWLVAMVDELAALIRWSGVPVISGKDSSAGSTPTDDGVVSVPPAVFLSGLGKVPDKAQLLGEAWTTAGSLLVRVGPPTPSPAGTVAARLLDLAPGPLDDVGLEQAGRYLAALREHRHRFRSGTRLGSGGVAAALVKGALATGLGVDLDFELPGAGNAGVGNAGLGNAGVGNAGVGNAGVGNAGVGNAGVLFAEHRVGALVEIDAGDLDALPPELHPVVLGRLTGDGRITTRGGGDLLTPEVRDAWANSFTVLLG